MSTPTQEVELKAGRELDALIAEKVMERVVEKRDSEHGVRFLELFKGAAPWGGRRWQTLPHYSTDVGDAWGIIEVMRSRGWKPSLETEDDRSGGSFWTCTMGNEMHDAEYAMNENPAFAICLAALKAVESR